ncbi:histamine H2 receptor-like [Rhopilema esculentum]|uniref:histamine H2 receptor-like n=1 Tax=Rhopilema esculentum TaxID=499914 RepID=UPI0031DEE5DE|eukprot:gene4994-58_t
MNTTLAPVSACKSITPDVSQLSKSHRLAMFSFNAALIPITLVSNSVVIIGLLRSKSSGSKLLIVFLCITDLLVGVLLMPLSSAYILSPVVHSSCKAKSAIQFLSHTFLLLDFTTVLAIGIERLIVLKYPMQDLFFRWQAVRKYVLMCTIFWVLLFASIVILVTNNSDVYYAVKFASFAIYVAILVTLVSCYAIVCRHVRNSVKKLYNGNDNHIQSRSRQLRHDMALARSVSVILSFQLSMCTPYFITMLFWNWEMFKFGKPKQLSSTILVWTFLPLLINSSANAFIYSYYNRPLRQYFVQTYSCLFRFIPRRKETRGNTNEEGNTKKTKESRL